MDLRKKAAIIVTCMNLLLTVLKFSLYFITGSFVILAEAWHSFSDIATSLLVFIAIAKLIATEQTTKGDQKEPAVPASVEDRPVKKKKWNLEQKISLGIGLFLFCVSIMLIRQVLLGQQVEVQKPISAGLVFLVFALGSHLVARFEKSVGEKFNSVGLISDSMHAKADMTASLLAGFSLILYGLGINIDRWAALLISGFILSFSIEVMVNVFIAHFRGEEKYIFRYKSYQILSYLVSPKELRKAVLLLESKLGLHVTQKTWFHRFSRLLRYGVPVIILGCYLSTSVYVVSTSEQAIVNRFGQAIVHQGIQPGLHLKLPWPIDRVVKEDVRTIRNVAIGNVTDTQSAALLWTRVHGTEEAFLSGDNYFLFPYINIHYRIKDVYSYMYNIVNPVELVSACANQLVSQLVATKTFYDIVTVYRVQLCAELVQKLQDQLDHHNSGIDIVSINFKDIHPPISIADSFEQVIAAIQEKEQIINEAYAYRNKNIPEAIGQSFRELEAAQSYNVTKVERALGDGRGFQYRNQVFSENVEILSKLIHLQTIQSALADTEKILYDPRAGHPGLWIGKKGAELLPWQKGGDEQ